MCTKCIVLFLPSGKVVLYGKRISIKRKEDKKEVRCALGVAEMVRALPAHVTLPIGKRHQCFSQKPQGECIKTIHFLLNLDLKNKALLVRKCPGKMHLGHLGHLMHLPIQ